MRSRRTIVVLILAVIVLLLTAIPGKATFAKVFSFSVTPSGVAAGGTSQFSASITNKSLYKIGSAEVTVPFSTFTVASDPKVTVNGNKILIKNMNLLLTRTYTVKVTATVPCANAPLSWSARASSASTFPATPDFSGNPGSASTNVTGSCAPDSLRFRDGFAPKDAAVGASIGPVVVEVIRNGSVLTSFNDEVTLVAQGDPDVLEGGVVLAENGVATFPSPFITAAGTFTIVATGGGLTSPPAAPQISVTITDAILGCPGDPDSISFYSEDGVPGDVDLQRETSENCTPTPLNIVFDDDNNIVELQKQSLAGSLFTMSITWSVEEDATYPLPATQIDYGSGFSPMLGCLTDGANGSTPPGFPDLPGTEKWCVSTHQASFDAATGTAEVTETYVGTDDPRFKR